MIQSNASMLRSLVLSIAALILVGATDMVSVIIRAIVVQMATPDEMRGRVNAVDLVFVGASNELGQFESGLAANRSCAALNSRSSQSRSGMGSLCGDAHAPMRERRGREAK